MKNATKAWIATLSLALASASGSARADTCIGSCGTDVGANGSITLPPTGTPFYQWISTNGGAAGAGSLGVGTVTGNNETNGSSFTYSPFSAQAGDRLSFYFNYITSDGNQFPDYAWSQLYNAAGGGLVATLITAETQPSGNIVPAHDPGFPPVTVTLNPASVPIISGGPNDVWSHLGQWSGLCYGATVSDQGCGHTGWIQASYIFQSTGTFLLTMGVTNVIDEKYDSGLAFGDPTINGVPLGQGPLPAALPMFVAGLGGLGMLAWRRRRTLRAAHRP
jgi:hypothetical protein